MNSANNTRSSVWCLVLLITSGGVSALAQQGNLKFEITPPQAYVFVDGEAISEVSKILSLRISAGDHQVVIANYGYAPAMRTVSIEAGKTTNLDLTLTPIADQVSGPFGAMTIEGGEHDAVLLNGKTPAFFVGHGDEFNHARWWKQELVVPPGPYLVTIKHGETETWSGPVDIEANKRVVIDVPRGVRKTVDWPRGEKFNSVPRFNAGIASARVAVAKPTAELSLTATQINCGDSTALQWRSTDAPQVEIAPIGSVNVSGERDVQPYQTTTYSLTALGPGGRATSSTTVNVNTAVQADLGLSPTEVSYHRVGGEVIGESSLALKWSASNASAVSIDPLGTVDSSGSRNVSVTPRKTGVGPVDETATYTLKASNGCGGTLTKTATLHIVGSIEGEPSVAEALTPSMRSIFFPTDLPWAANSGAALLPSEEQALRSFAPTFQKYLAAHPDAKLILTGHADERGPEAYNQSLSVRRALVAKQFLIEQGLPEASIETRAYGETQNLTADRIRELIIQNTDLSTNDQQQLLKFGTVGLAYNRRVDINLVPTGQVSVVLYPHKSEDAVSLMDRNGPYQNAEGVLSRVDSAKRLLWVKDQAGNEMQFKYTSQTQVTGGDNSVVGLAKIGGTHVKIQYGTVAGANNAVKIYIVPDNN